MTQEAGKSKEQIEAEKRYPCPPSGFSYNKSKQLAFIAGTEYAQQREQPWVGVEKFTIGFTEWLITHPDKWMFSKKLMTWWSPYLTEDKCTSELIKLYKESFPPAPPKD